MPHPEGVLLGLSKLDRILSIDPEYSLGNERWRDQELDLIVELPTGASIVIDEITVVGSRCGPTLCRCRSARFA